MAEDEKIDKKEKKKKKKQKLQKLAERPSLVLPGPDDTPWLTIHGEAVHSYRHMLSRMNREGYALPHKLGLLATLRQEGTTHTALALATTMAVDLQKSICVVELNWHWPGMIKLLPQLESPGLAAVLQEEISVDEAIVATGLPNLSLLPAGELALEKRPITARSTQLANIIAELGKKFDHLLLDVPAILATSDAIALATLSEACVVVIHQGVTPIGDVKRALDDVEHIKMLGVIMNQVSIKTPKLFLKMIPQG
ncbi:MAG: CpsD/CapB family tyrosine-protein kinase [Anaerolineales bacterium]|nr:CpsD/CapB family tyrosine-protein kinase [Anaerolineales bacterium]